METLASQPADTAQPQLFLCKPAEASPAQQALIFILIGALVGAVGWFEVDRTITFAHLAAWVGGTAVLFGPFAWILTRNPVISITVDDRTLTVERARRPLKFAWSEIEAARFQDYPLSHSVGGGTMRCFLVRARGENFELTPGFADPETEAAFEDAILRELEFHDVPETAKSLPSFEHVLAVMGAWLFAVSIAGILAAHALGYRTLGTIFGLGALVTGSVIAGMTRRERVSRVVLIATIALILGGSAILWACHVNLRETLNRWEWVERSK